MGRPAASTRSSEICERRCAEATLTPTTVPAVTVVSGGHVTRTPATFFAGGWAGGSEARAGALKTSGITAATNAIRRISRVCTRDGQHHLTERGALDAYPVTVPRAGRTYVMSMT